jgi:hypothetical protein
MNNRKLILGLALSTGLALIAVLLVSLKEKNVHAQGREYSSLSSEEGGLSSDPTRATLGVHQRTLQQTFAPAWFAERVDTRVGSSGPWVSLALAPTVPFTPHVAYMGDTLRYAIYDGGNWITRTVDSVRGWGGVSLALAPTEPYTPFIAYCDFDRNELKYARWTGVGWAIETVDSVGDTHWGVSLALEPPAPYIPHIAYIGDGNLKYARWTGVGWAIETVDYKTDSFWTLESPSLALASVAPYPPLISYHDTDSGYVRLARRAGGGWTKENVVYSMNSTGYTSLVLDTSDNPHIAYDEWNNWYLKYARWSGATWVVETVDRSGVPSLVLDSNDQPRIGYYVGSDLRYAYRSGSTWITETVDGLERSSEYEPSLALDAGDHPSIAYYDTSNGDIRFAWQQRVGVIPSGGGTFAPHGSIDFDFPPGAITDTIVLTYAVLQPFGSQPHVGDFFNISAVYAGTGQVAQVATGHTYTVNIRYTDAQKGPAIEDTLRLYWWNEGASQWSQQGITSTVNITDNLVTAQVDHFSPFAVLGETRRVYLPLVLRS